MTLLVDLQRLKDLLGKVMTISITREFDIDFGVSERQTAVKAKLFRLHDIIVLLAFTILLFDHGACESSKTETECHFCKDGICEHGNKTCSLGCAPGYCGDNCSKSCPPHCSECEHDCDCTLCDDESVLFSTRQLINICLTCPHNCLECDTSKPGRNSLIGHCRDCVDRYQNWDKYWVADNNYINEQVTYACSSCACFECAYGWSGPNCEYECQTKPYCSSCSRHKEEMCLSCHPNKYGYNSKTDSYDCHLNCSDNCANGSCDDHSGHCTGCVDGLWGHQCEFKCSHTCRLSKDGNNYCDQTSGTCLHGCEDGYHGNECDERCSTNCSYVKACDQFTGACKPSRFQDSSDADGTSNVDIKIWLAIPSALVLCVIIAIFIIVMVRKKRRNDTSSMERNNRNEQTVDAETRDRIVPNTTKQVEAVEPPRPTAHGPLNNDLEYQYVNADGNIGSIYSDLDADNNASSLYLDLSNDASGGAARYVTTKPTVDEAYECLDENAKEERFYSALQNNPKIKRKK